MPKTGLEEQLTSLTHEFVARLVDAIRNASFAQVAALSLPRVVRGNSAHAPPPTPPKRAATSKDPGLRVRQTAARRAELSERVIRTLQTAGKPMGVRALSGELGVVPDVLAIPLRELRDAGRVQKHGEKRSTTYSVD
jgi:hypothetical protein